MAGYSHTNGMDNVWKNIHFLQTLTYLVPWNINVKFIRENKQSIPKKGTFNPGIDASGEGIQERELFPITP